MHSRLNTSKTNQVMVDVDVHKWSTTRGTVDKAIHYRDYPSRLFSNADYSQSLRLKFPPRPRPAVSSFRISQRCCDYQERRNAGNNTAV